VAAALAFCALVPASAVAQDDAWVQSALADQYELGGDLGLRNAPWVGTHNSFNSVAEMGPTLSAQDSNQRIDILAQLENGIRSLELDLHWFLHAPSASFRPVVCHATGEHFGCTVEKPLGPVLEEIGDWLRLPENADQVLLLYLEDHLDTEEGYDTGAAEVEAELGDLLYRPPAGGCAELPLDLTRDDIRAAGAQVVIVSGCGIGAAWPAVAHSWASHVESRPFSYQDFPDCGPDYDRATYDSTLVRYYEDSTQLTATAGNPDDGISPETAAAMARCGVDLIGLDQVEAAGDPRLGALVWSWAEGQPNRGGCALAKVSDAEPHGRWFSRRCRRPRPVACLEDAGWRVLKARAPAVRAAKRCDRRDARWAAPRTGHEAQLLRLALEGAAGGRTKAWIGYRRIDGDWAPQDQR